MQQMRKRQDKKLFVEYLVSAILFWFVVDFTTTGAIKEPARYYSTFMPALLIFYIGFPLTFAFLIYKLKWNNRRLFIATLIGAFLVEVVFTQNALLFTFPTMFLAIPAAASIYSLLTFIPKWLVEGQLGSNKWKSITLMIVYILISLATVFGRHDP